MADNEVSNGESFDELPVAEGLDIIAATNRLEAFKQLSWCFGGWFDRPLTSQNLFQPRYPRSGAAPIEQQAYVQVTWRGSQGQNP